MARTRLFFALPLLLALLVCPTGGKAAQTGTVHILVALCDNVNQGIVPVPAALGNGQDPERNLYWGAADGVKTFFRKQKDWTLAHSVQNPTPDIIERLVFTSAQGLTLVADAYDGARIDQTTEDLMYYAAGLRPLNIQVGDKKIAAGGASALVIYIGHNRLMDFSARLASPAFPKGGNPPSSPAVAIFACQSRAYFLKFLQEAGGKPLLMTTGNMCPEAYSAHALIQAWSAGEDKNAIREAVAEAYNKYQKCGLQGARRLFAFE